MINYNEDSNIYMISSVTPSSYFYTGNYVQYICVEWNSLEGWTNVQAREVKRTLPTMPM